VQPRVRDKRVALSIGRVQGALLRITAFRPDRDGRIVVAGTLAVYLAAVALPRLLWGIDIWPRLGVPAGSSLFLDTRVVTAGLECRRLGLDPLRYNPCDPLGRQLNYPRVWLLLRYLGLNQSHTDLLAIIFIALFLSTLFLFFGRLRFGEGILVAAALCSPSVMFGVERANVDIVVFAFLALAVLVWRMEAAAGRVASPLVVLLAAVTKLYPVVVLPAYLFTRRKWATLTALGCVAAFAIYAFVFRADIRAVARATPQGQYNAYGARILPAVIYHRLIPDQWQGGPVTKQVLALVPLLVATPVVWLIGRRRLPRPDSGQGSWRRLAFHLGSLVFLGTFAAFNSFDYRLVFILLTLPQLFEWIADPSPDPRGALAAIATVSILVLLWVGALSKQLGLTDELATWATAGLLLALLAASIPPLREVWSSGVRGS
jgi:hypothetical protein